MKYSTDAGQTWNHASLASKGVDPVGFSAPSGFEIEVPADTKGFFFRRSLNGSGNIDAEDVRFSWDYGQDGLSDDVAQAANTITKLYGIEMVYIPEGGFYAGDGASSSDYRFKQGSTDDDPWYISSETAINVTNATSDGFYYQSSGSTGESSSGDGFILANSFPKGYSAFYMMKYELTEGNWVSFFNTLSQAERTARDITGSTDGGKNSDAVVMRNTVSWDASGVLLAAETDRPARAMTYVSWADVAAFADWAALRPMSELEFEKAARGADIAPVANEYAWGTVAYDAAASEEIFPPNSDEDGTESI